MTPGYLALRQAAALLDLTGRGEIFVAGEDRMRLLHAISTNHIERLQPGEGCYAFFLNAQGKILADAFVFCLPSRLLVDTEPETAEKLRRHIDKYIIAEDVALHDATAGMAVLGVEGREAEAVLVRLGIPVPAAEYGVVEWGEALVARASATGSVGDRGFGFRILAPIARREELIGLLQLPVASALEQRTVRLENGRPRYGEDITEVTLPQESQQMHAVSFNKGCYIGQEIVERIRARGQVHRKLERLEYLPGLPPDAQITSEIYSPAAEKMVALGYTRA
jgi:folate-binding protein YgfZ